MISYNEYARVVDEGERQAREIGGLLQQIKSQQREIGELREVLDWMVKLFENSKKGAFSNGVTDQSGMMDQGDVFADRIINESRALLNARKEQPK